MKKIILAIALFISSCTFAQTKELSSPEIEFGCSYPVPLKLAPEFIGGEAGLSQFIRNRLEYPKRARRRKTIGKVIASFIIEKDGAISNINILKSLPNGCDQAVINVIKKMPRWKPAMENGKLIKFSYELAVEFELEK